MNNHADERIRANIEIVKAKIKEAAAVSGRCSDDITLIAVSKTRSMEEIFSAVNAGALHLGENRVQEIVAKYDSYMAELLQLCVNIHMIGNLQRNKVKYINDKVTLIHSIDSFKLAAEVDRQMQKSIENGSARDIMDVLIEVNYSMEHSKQGVLKEDALVLISEITEKLEHVRVKGLMTVAPYFPVAEDTRYVFAGLKELSEKIKLVTGKDGDSLMEYLSMGMTNDYVVAIEEGSNMVRVGNGIFGPRVYS